MTARIQHDIDRINLPWIRSIALRANPFQCDIYFRGPAGTDYYLKVFHVFVQFPANYPFLPPIVTFLQETDLQEVDPVSGIMTMKILDPRYWDSTCALLDIMTCLYYIMKTQRPKM